MSQFSQLDTWSIIHELIDKVGPWYQHPCLCWGNREWTRCLSARKLVKKLTDSEVILPAQTLGELSRVLVAKDKRNNSQVRETVLEWADSFLVADSTWFAFQTALDLTVDHQIPIWDALILSVAAEHHCRLLLSEDFQNGLTWQGVTVINPFTTPPSSLLNDLFLTSV